MIDAVTAMRTLLQQDVALTALTVDDDDHGIYRADEGLPATVNDANTAPDCVVIAAVGGVSDVASPRIFPRFYVRTYGASGVKAMQIFRAMADIFVDDIGMQRGWRIIVGPARSWLLFGATLSLPIVTREPETDWPVAIATLHARMSAREA